MPASGADSGSLAAAIRREADGEAAERLFEELAERLEEPGLEEETASLPVEEIVQLLCRDLGLAMEAVRAVGSLPDGVGRREGDSCWPGLGSGGLPKYVPAYAVDPASTPAFSV